jgi:dihydrofolate reductase
MNKAEKIVFSRTLLKAEWTNTRVIKDNIEDEIGRMKRSPGKDMTLLGSGTILAFLADEGLIDEYQIMVDPVVLGVGTPIFKGVKQRLELKLTSSRTFRSGLVLLCYRPKRTGR